MADNWDSAYPDFQIPATAPPNLAPQQPQVPVASAWDQSYPNFVPPPAAPSMAGQIYQTAKDYAAPLATGDFWKGTAYGLGQDALKPMYAASRGIEYLVPPSPGVKPASQQIEGGYNKLTEQGSPNFEAGRSTGDFAGQAAEQALATYLTRGMPFLGQFGASGPIGSFLGAINTPPGPDYGTRVGNNALNSGIANAASTGLLHYIFPGPTADIQRLRSAGVQPTPGATAGGIPGMAEDFLSKIPLVGDAINSGRASARQQFAAANARAAATPLSEMTMPEVENVLTQGGNSYWTAGRINAASELNKRQAAAGILGRPTTEELPDVLPIPGNMSAHDRSVMQWGPKLALIEEAVRHYAEPVFNYATAHPGTTLAAAVPVGAALHGAYSNFGRNVLNPAISTMSGLLKYLAPAAAENASQNQEPGMGLFGYF